jgi:hypothetical protein
MRLLVDHIGLEGMHDVKDRVCITDDGWAALLVEYRWLPVSLVINRRPLAPDLRDIGRASKFRKENQIFTTIPSHTFRGILDVAQVLR